ncbi:MAG: alpha/beta hydrolase-fold protein [Neisseria sp.]|nr:alpha/beta hydrolase-fold protein [Neisseria sp.]
MKRLFCAALPLLPACILHAAAPAPFVPPEIGRQADESILAAPDSAYTFRTLELPSADGLRHYRVFVGIPRAKPPQGGFSVWYALDGNALLEYLTPENLRRLAEDDPPVLVLVGYATGLRFDTAARAYDYTPPDKQGRILPDTLHPARSNGGAPGFLALLTGEIRRQAEQGVPINDKRRTLWGHSYGGVFVLYALSANPASFDRYIAADPSLWLHKGLILQYTENIPPQAWGKTLLIQKSGRRDEKQPANPQQAAQLAEREKTVASVPPHAAERLAGQLRRRGLKVQYRFFADLTHGQLLAASFGQLLARGATPCAKAQGCASDTPPKGAISTVKE